MKKLISVILFISIIVGCLGQTGCDNEKYPNGEIKIFCWGEYIADGTFGSLDVINEFEKETKIRVSVFSTFDSNEQMYAKLKSNSASYDIIMPSDYMISRLIAEDMIQKINISEITNYTQVMDKCKGSVCGYDPTDEYSVPYSWGTLGLVYNGPLIEQLTGQSANEIVKGWDALWNKKLAKEMFMFINSRDSFGIAEKYLGYSLNTTNVCELKNAYNALKEQKPLVQAYIMDEIFDKMENNEAAIAPAYSGDIITMMNENDKLSYCFPEQGSNIFVDGICIPKNAKNIQNAHKFIDFLCKPNIAAANAQYISYSTPNVGAWEKLDDSLKYNKIAYPPDEIINKCETYMYLPPSVNSYIESSWTEIRN